MERDLPDQVAVLDTEEQAYDYVYEMFCKWLGLHRSHLLYFAQKI